MKTSFLSRNRSSHPFIRRAGWLVVGFVVAVYVLSILRAPIVAVATPLWRGENLVARTINNITGFFHTKNSLVKENEVLKERLRIYEVEKVNNAGFEAREANLLNLIGRNLSSHGIVASVLSRPPQSPYDVLVIDVGSQDGVSLGLKVNMSEGPVLGVVSELFDGTAKVKLFTASGEETSAVLERGGEPVILAGRGGGIFKLTLPREMDVEIGDRIISADIRADLVAVVGDISMRPTDSFKEVLAKSPLNIFELRFVIVNQ